MKTTKKIKIWGVIQLIIGPILVLLGTTVFNDGFMPYFPLFVPGILLSFSAFMIIIFGFTPEITKFMSKVQTETIEHSGQEMGEAYSKMSETVVPAVTPSIKKAVSEINGGIKKENHNDLEAQLTEIKKLKDKGIITTEEYTEMRKNILGLDDN